MGHRQRLATYLGPDEEKDGHPQVLICCNSQVPRRFRRGVSLARRCRFHPRLAVRFAPWGVAKKKNKTNKYFNDTKSSGMKKENNRQSSSRMTLFSFATQATERVLGTSIEKPRGWVLNLAAYL